MDPNGSVTGGALGLESATAQAGLAAGARVVVLDIETGCEARVDYKAFDITDDKAVEEAVVSIAERFGRIDATVEQLLETNEFPRRAGRPSDLPSSPFS